MTTADEGLIRGNAASAAAPPFIEWDDVNVPSATPMWHFDQHDRLREGADVYFGDARGHEFWYFSRMADIRAVFQNPRMFSNTAVGVTEPNPPYTMIPENLDPPMLTKWRKLLGPLFSPGASATREARIQERFDEILDEIVPRGECDYLADVAVRFPNVIFMEIMGLPVTEAAMFQAWEHQIMHGDFGGEVSLRAMGEVSGYLEELIAERRRNPRQDLVSTAIGWEIDNVPVTDAELLSLGITLFTAGLDTVAQQLSYATLHLATHDDDRQRLVADPSLFQTAVEEFLRYYGHIDLGRKIMYTEEFRGCPMKQGQMVHLPISSANRDPDEFPDADCVLIDRSPNRHIAFGAGPHRCLGSHLARVELNTGLKKWHERIPNYRLAPGEEVREHGGIIGLDNLPLVWNVD